jgi:hypothetical protein
MASFVLGYVTDHEFLNHCSSEKPAENWLFEKRPEILEWLKESGLIYDLLFEYQCPIVLDKPPIRVRIEFPDENEAIQFRLTWS